MPPEPPPLPPLGPIVERLEAQLAGEPGTGRLSREDVLVLAVLAVEREATRSWTLHRADCDVHQPARWMQRCTCGLGDAEARSMLLRQRLVPPEPPADLRRRGKRGPVR